MTVLRLDNEKTLRAFERFGVLEETVNPVFPDGSERIFRALQHGGEMVDLRKLSDEELFEWVNSTEAFCNLLGERGCFYGEELFEDGLQVEHRADDRLVRFRGRHPIRRMF